MKFSCFLELVSQQRLQKYIDIFSEEKAAEKYHLNLDVSIILFKNIHWLEIILRNKINNNMINSSYGHAWINKININDDIADITKKSLRYWVNLFDKNCEELWRHHLYKIFQKKTTRKEIFGLLLEICKFRNRIAHHECIIHKEYALCNNYIHNIVAWLSNEEIASELIFSIEKH
jgi:hypothetical protein